MIYILLDLEYYIWAGLGCGFWVWSNPLLYIFFWGQSSMFINVLISVVQVMVFAQILISLVRTQGVRMMYEQGVFLEELTTMEKYVSSFLDP